MSKRSRVSPHMENGGIEFFHSECKIQKGKCNLNLINQGVDDDDDPDAEISRFNQGLVRQLAAKDEMIQDLRERLHVCDSKWTKRFTEQQMVLDALENAMCTTENISTQLVEACGQKDREIAHRQLTVTTQCGSLLAAKDNAWEQKLKEAVLDVKKTSAAEVEKVVQVESELRAKLILSDEHIEKLNEEKLVMQTDYEDIIALHAYEASVELQRTKEMLKDADPDPFMIQRKKLEYIDLLEQKFKDSAPDGNLDSRTVLLIKDKRLSVLGQGSTMPLKALSVSEVADSLGYALTRDQLCEVGKPIGNRYRSIHGERPEKHSQYVNGKSTIVNNYYETDRWLLEEELKKYWQLSRDVESIMRDV